MLNPARLITCFGTQVYVDPVSRALRHGDAELVPANALLIPGRHMNASPKIVTLTYEGDGTRRLIECRMDGCIVTDHEAVVRTSNGEIALEIVALERGLFALSAGGKYLTAHPDGRIELSAPLCSTWELFLASEEWCTSSGSLETGSTPPSMNPIVDQKAVSRYRIHPTIRARSGITTRTPKILVFGYTKWSHGRVYYDLCKKLYEHGYIVDVLDWQANHHDYIHQLTGFYDWLMVALDGISVLADVYGVPPERMIAVSHNEFDVRMLEEQKSSAIFDQFAGYGAVSESVYCASQVRGIARAPLVASLGINYDEFFTAPSEELNTVGYATSMATRTFGVEWKRGHLAEKAAHAAGLRFSVAGSTADQISFHDMPDFYRTVDAVLMSSITEAAPLPVMEAAAAGRLVIGTPAGHFPLRAYEGGGILAPVQADKYVAFCAETLRAYHDDPIAYREKCRDVQNAARKFDWQHHISGWVELIAAAGRAPSLQARQAHNTDGRLPPQQQYQFSVDWFTKYIPIWNPLLDELKPRKILEIGCYEGRSTCHLIERCSKHDAIELVCIDTWEGGFEHRKDLMHAVEQRFDHNIQLAIGQSPNTIQIRKVKKPSLTALAELISSEESLFDLIYIDGSHLAVDVLTDAVLAFQTLRPGGLLIFDDYLWSADPKGQEDVLKCPKEGIDNFVNLFRKQITVLSGLPLEQLYVKKNA